PWSTRALVAVPYCLGVVLALCYIMQAPDVFLAQARVSWGYRVGNPLTLLRNVLDDIYTRYLGFYFEHLSGIGRLKFLGILFGVFGFLATLFDRRLRSEELGRLLLALSLTSYLGVAALDNMKFPYYMVYVTPIFSACGALWVYHSFHRAGVRRLIGGLLLAGSLTAAIGGFARNIYRDDFRRVYDPTVACIRGLLRPGDIVTGPSQLAFAFGFGPSLIDDCYLGYASGKKSKVYVMHDSCGPARGKQQGWEWSRELLGEEYEKVFINDMYTVYVRRIR
ncbi:MAG: hypothetical protein M3Y72_02535, partial [Acidobacteriota bacterium]|nr:hypothetical protein [Acidobacteriota bacterium]